MSSKSWLTLTTLLLFSLIATTSSCNKSEDNNNGVNLAAEPFEWLSEYGIYVNELANMEPNSGVVPYSLNSTLFTDFSQKQRFVYIPDGLSATYNGERDFEFPDGSILIKNFFYQDDLSDPNSSRQIIETRLLMKKSGEWDAETYVWNKEQTDAERKIAGGTKAISWIDEDGINREVDYIIPNKNECKGCHEYNDDLVPIGPKAKHLNGDYEYATGTMNQIEYWQSNGMLTGVPTSALPKLAVWNDPSTGSLDERARAYLDINCGYCHNPKGPANNSGLHLEAEVQDPETFGICKGPVAAGKGSGGFQFDIKPGHPEESILVFRMQSDDPEVRMPELGRSTQHTEAVALISEWIRQLPGDCN